MSAAPSPQARTLIDHFQMIPHPEGGWYAETFRAPAAPGERPVVSAIYFLLDRGQRSHWHQVDATEIWLWHAGAPVLLEISADSLPSRAILLGSDLARGEQPQAVVPEGAWQAAESTSGWSLVSCVVTPAFHFGGFTLAPSGWSPPSSL